MSASFSGGFINGLPEMFFDEALLWQPREPMQRRFNSTDRENPPSWAWAGWEGAIMASAWEEHFGHLMFRRAHFERWHARGDIALPVIPTVKWTWGRTLEERFPINPSGLRYAEHLTEPSLPLPSGWSKKGLVYTFDEDPAPQLRIHYPSPMAKDLALFPPGTSSVVLLVVI
jgi:hypothetical protein